MKNKILIVCIVILLGAVGVMGYYLLQPKEETKTGALVVDESNLAEIQEYINEKEEEGRFEVNMNTIWHFPNGNSPSSDAYVANSAVNHYPISFKIITDEEVVYESTIIPLGNKIKEIALNRNLPKGEYVAVCQYTMWNEDGTEHSTFGVNITLVIQE